MSLFASCKWVDWCCFSPSSGHICAIAPKCHVSPPYQHSGFVQVTVPFTSAESQQWWGGYVCEISVPTSVQVHTTSAWLANLWRCTGIWSRFYSTIERCSTKLIVCIVCLAIVPPPLTLEHAWIVMGRSGAVCRCGYGI